MPRSTAPHPSTNNHRGWILVAGPRQLSCSAPGFRAPRSAAATLGPSAMQRRSPQRPGYPSHHHIDLVRRPASKSRSHRRLRRSRLFPVAEGSSRSALELDVIAERPARPPRSASRVVAATSAPCRRAGAQRTSMHSGQCRGRECWRRRGSVLPDLRRTGEATLASSPAELSPSASRAAPSPSSAIRRIVACRGVTTRRGFEETVPLFVRQCPYALVSRRCLAAEHITVTPAILEVQATTVPVPTRLRPLSAAEAVWKDFVKKTTMSTGRTDAAFVVAGTG